MTIETRLEELGIVLPEAPASLASYVRTVVFQNLVFVSGQLPIKNGQIETLGKVGREVSVDLAIDAAKQCAINAISALKDELGDLEKISQIIKLTGFVASDPQFTAQPQVVNGASDLFLSIFGEKGRHSRSAVGVSSLPLNAPVEIELIVGIQ